MAAYFIATPEAITDMDLMGEYAAGAPAVVEEFGGRYLVPRGVAEAFAGEWDPGFMVMIEFPDRARVREFYESPEYRPWREMQERAARISILVTADE
jgi:uncharacterized protein (DUF1330 family)